MYGDRLNMEGAIKALHLACILWGKTSEYPIFPSFLASPINFIPKHNKSLQALTTILRLSNTYSSELTNRERDKSLCQLSTKPYLLP